MGRCEVNAVANNRIYLRCRACGETLFLGKHFVTPFYYFSYDGERLEDKLNSFFDKHAWCDRDGGEGELECFDIEYEIEPDWREKEKALTAERKTND